MWIIEETVKNLRIELEELRGNKTMAGMDLLPFNSREITEILSKTDPSKVWSILIFDLSRMENVCAQILSQLNHCGKEFGQYRLERNGADFSSICSSVPRIYLF